MWPNHLEQRFQPTWKIFHLSFIFCYFWKKLNLSYLSQTKKQSFTIRLCFLIMLYITRDLFIFFSGMLNMIFNSLLVYQLTLISNLSDWLMLNDKISEPSENSIHINLSKGVKILLILYSFLHDEKKRKKRKILKIRKLQL